MLVATWNINGIKARIDNAAQWLKTAAPDVCCLQEIKAEDASFPRGIIEELGYNVAVHGQKGFNGVAILSKRPFSDVRARLPGDPSDEQARYLEAVVPTDYGIVRVAAIYLPNGNPPETDKYRTKLRWMDRLTMHARELLTLEEPLVLAGDYNVIPAPKDARYPANWTNDALFLPQTREKYGALLSLGLVDAAARHFGERRYFYILGLSGRRLAKRQWDPDRPYPAVAAGGRSPAGHPHRQTSYEPGNALRTTCR